MLKKSDFTFCKFSSIDIPSTSFGRLSLLLRVTHKMYQMYLF